MLGNSDETVSIVKRRRFVVDSVDHDKACRSDLPGSDCLPQCLRKLLGHNGFREFAAEIGATAPT
ncbi:hypothetical protein BST29_20770 [Mycobacterium malmoense]|uniref:Transposase n=2 Tax=Mycobacterium malmoense TaxID=1780 RepID=A0ABX3SP09_MYCMA|nr:hypothetical protein BMG05_00720 [Mycobacterium malmoense]ORA78803.1 hypothetical protein BST29_20770 [Mycobacterium malmoense]